MMSSSGSMSELPRNRRDSLSSIRTSNCSSSDDVEKMRTGWIAESPYCSFLAISQSRKPSVTSAMIFWVQVWGFVPKAGAPA